MTIKNSLLIDSDLPLKFWAEVINITNYLQNRFFIKNKKDELISKKLR